jgi:glycine/D-amino acid oxidase-like deaminating enzyme
MMHAAQAQGAELRLARVTGLTRSSSAVSGVETDAGRIECDAIVIAMGP